MLATRLRKASFQHPHCFEIFGAKVPDLRKSRKAKQCGSHQESRHGCLRQIEERYSYEAQRTLDGWDRR
jgi:hypothetical protein